MISPTASPAITGSMPDFSSATHTATPTTAATRSRHSGGAKRSANSVRNRPAATASGTTLMCSVYAVAITISATKSSITASVSSRTRRRVARAARSPSAPSANAVSVDIAAPQPLAPSPPALNARKIAIGTDMPPSAAATEIQIRRRSRSWPRSSSRLASSPTTRK